MTPLSNARIESQKSGGHKDRTFAEEEDARAPASQARQDSRAGGGGLRVGSAGTAEVLLVPTCNLKLIFNKQGRAPIKTLVLRDKINHKTSIYTDTHINKSVGTCWGFAIAFYKSEFIFLPHFF